MFRQVLYLAALIAAIAAGSYLAAQEPGVIVPEGGFSNTQVYSTGPASTVYNGLYGIPEDDANKWHITLFYGENQASRQVRQAFATDAALAQLRAWGHFKEHDVSRASQALRTQAYAATQNGSWPLLVVYPPKQSTVYKYRYAGRLSGAALAAKTGRDIAGYIAGQVQSFIRVRDNYRSPQACGHYHAGQCPGPYCPVNPRPRPRPDNTPSPDPVTPYVPPIPDIPDIPDVPDVPDVPDIDPDHPLRPLRPDRPDQPGAFGPYPEHVEVVLITDPNGLFERVKERALIALFQKARARSQRLTSISFKHYRLGVDVEGINVDVRTARARTKPRYPVTAGQTPAVIITEHGDLRDKITGPTVETLVDLIQEFLPSFGQDPPPRDLSANVHVAPADMSGVEAAMQAQAASQQAGQKSLMTALLGLGGGGIALAVGGLLVLLIIWKKTDGKLDGHLATPEAIGDWLRERSDRYREFSQSRGWDEDPDDEDQAPPPRKKRPARKRPTKKKAT